MGTTACNNEQQTQSRADLARYLKVSRSYITQLGNQGRLVEDDQGRILLDETLALIEASTDQPESDLGKNEIARARMLAKLKKEEAAAEIEVLSLQRLKGELVPVADVERAAQEQAALLRAVLDELAAQRPEDAELLRLVQTELADRAELLATIEE